MCLRVRLAVNLILSSHNVYSKTIPHYFQNSLPTFSEQFPFTCLLFPVALGLLYVFLRERPSFSNPISPFTCLAASLEVTELYLWPSWLVSINVRWLFVFVVTEADTDNRCCSFGSSATAPLKRLYGELFAEEK